MNNTSNHQGPDPEYGGMTTHVGTRENCSAPDCGPLDAEDVIREAVLNLDSILGDQQPTSPILANPQVREIGRLLGDLLHEIAEDMDPKALTPVQEAAHKLATTIHNATLATEEAQS